MPFTQLLLAHGTGRSWWGSNCPARDTGTGHQLPPTRELVSQRGHREASPLPPIQKSICCCLASKHPSSVPGSHLPLWARLLQLSGATWEGLGSPSAAWAGLNMARWDRRGASNGRCGPSRKQVPLLEEAARHGGLQERESRPRRVWRAAAGLRRPTEPSLQLWLAGWCIWQPLTFLFLSLHPALLQLGWRSWTLESPLFLSSGNTRGSLPSTFTP